ncbi:MAG: ATP-grasp fold amidoligase family protein [Syntrophomonadaceae bacterium]
MAEKRTNIIQTIVQRSNLARYYYLKLYWARLKDSKGLNDVEYFKRRHKHITGQELDLENPVTFTEKLYFLSLSNRDPLLKKCSDKYLVREYVGDCGLGHILNDLYGVYDSAADIDFDRLPSPCILKLNHASGFNAIYDRRKPFDKRDFVRKFDFMLKQDYYWNCREWNYKHIKPRIICERLLEDDQSGLGLIDYKFMCFRGLAKALLITIDTCDATGAPNEAIRRNLYDMDFNFLPVTMNGPNIPLDLVGKPANFEEMRSYAETLAKPFPHCRIDLYNVEGKIYFGEITFFHGAGLIIFEPHEWALQLGDWIDLTGYKIAADALLPPG